MSIEKRLGDATLIPNEGKRLHANGKIELKNSRNAPKPYKVSVEGFKRDRVSLVMYRDGPKGMYISKGDIPLNEIKLIYN